jgi:nickel/cobalt transporter (NicO) family protein
MRWIGLVVFSMSLCLCGSNAFAHPVPRGQHDRTIVVTLRPSMANKEVVIDVAYRLEVDELTVVLEDMQPFRDEIQQKKPAEVFGEFTRIYAPILARNLVAKVDGEALLFQCEKRSHTTEENGTKLGHLRCDFTFVTRFPLNFSKEQTFTFHEGNYVLQSGQIKLTWDFAPAQDLSKTPDTHLFMGKDWVAMVKNAKAPNPALLAKTPLQLEPGEDELLRDLVLPMVWGGVSFRQIDAKDLVKNAPASAKPNDPSAVDGGPYDLLQVFLASERGVVVVLLLSVLVGAAHALTPGHGKTLVAAYLVGQRGTMAHAFILGLVTTVTHTGIVLLIALGLLFVDEDSRQAVARSLGLFMGLALVCLGVWLLLQRLAGRADHFHLPGYGHHHHHDGDHPHVDPMPGPARPVTWTGLLVMGMTGGIAPCWDAVAMLVLAIGMNLLWLALPMLIAFSAGLASVLVLIGILVVHARRFLDARWSNSRAVRLLPIFSALFITAMGVVVCYQGVQGEAYDDHAKRPAAAARP